MGVKFICKKIRGLKIYSEKNRGLKILGFSEENTPGGLKMTAPLLVDTKKPALIKTSRSHQANFSHFLPIFIFTGIFTGNLLGK